MLIPARISNAPGSDEPEWIVKIVAWFHLPLKICCLLEVIQPLVDSPLWVDSVEKVDLLLGLRQNQVIGQREDSQHDGTIVERTRETVLLVQH